MIENLQSITKKQIGIAILIFLTVTMVPACFRQWKDVDTPKYFVDRGAPESVKLASVPEYQESLVSEFTFAMDQYDRVEQSAENQILWLEGLTDTLKDPATLMAFGINPAGGAVSTAIYLLGLITPLPGHARSKRKSYIKGTEDAKTAVELGMKIKES